MANVKLYGGVTYANFGIEDGSKSDELKELMPIQKCENYYWSSNTKLLVNFNNKDNVNNISGTNFDGAFNNIKAFRIYKTIGNSDKLHKVCEIMDTNVRIVEDFTVGDLCNYKYYIFPIVTSKMLVDEKMVEIETMSPMMSEDVMLNRGFISVVGLIESEEDNVYTIDENNLWKLYLNVNNDGFTLNTDKTFYQTQNTYGKMSGGNLKQRSENITGLLGKIDCDNKDKFVDSYDDIIEWENFVSNNSLKMLIDLRGIITIGDIEANPSISYNAQCDYAASVSFTFKQLNDIDNTTVLGRTLDVNPLKYNYLLDSKNMYLTDTDDTNIRNLITPIIGSGI